MRSFQVLWNFADYDKLTFYLLTNTTSKFYYIHLCVYVIVHTSIYAIANIWCSEKNLLMSGLFFLRVCGGIKLKWVG